MDITYAAKEACLSVAKPGDLAMLALKRLGRYLEAHQRMVLSLPFQTAGCIDVYSDTDWAGCFRSRKSASGGSMMIGAHMIKC